MLGKGLAAARRKLTCQEGQATVEAALVLPLVFVVILLLLQPAIVLYDRVVMANAAAEGCRFAATSADPEGVCKQFVLRRLGAIPPHELFHAHEAGCSWAIEVQGGESASQSRVSIENKLRPLPLLGVCAKALGLVDESGYLTVRVERRLDAQPAWAAPSGYDAGPSQWIGAWNHD